jgi:hypothetical protein
MVLTTGDANAGALTMSDDYRWGWRQTLTWKVGFRHAQIGIPYKCPWWADEQVYGLAYLQGKDVEIPRHPRDSRKPTDESFPKR